MYLVKQEIEKTKKYPEIKDVFWKAYKGVRSGGYVGKGVKILLLNAPCNGFGDVVFAMKLSKYLRDWFGATVTIASTNTDGFIQLGVRKNELVQLKYNKIKQCRRFAKLSIKNIPEHDLIFVAPLPFDFDISLQDVRDLIPYANKLNTFFFSEYNDHRNKKFDFPTGVGGNNMGMLFTDIEIPKKLDSLKNPYAVIYVAQSISGVQRCVLSFIEMICHKYKHQNMEIIVHPNLLDEILKNIKKITLGNYSNIHYKKDKTLTKMKDVGKGRTIIFNFDVLPVDYLKMQSLIKHSVNDILLTGDQSITDALSCCSNKNIFYQIAPWKEAFGKQLAKHLPNKYYLSKKTSCGTIKAISYRSNNNEFVERWDFRKNAKKKLRGIVFSAKEMKRDYDLRKLRDLILKSKSLKSIKSRLL